MLDISQSSKSNLYEIKQLDPNGLTTVDLFCGAGVGAYGIKHAGYNILWGVDNDEDAVKTYNINISNNAICEDIRKISVDDIPKCDLLVATPVCKPFTIAAADKRKLTDDEKYGDLLAETIRIFGGLKPKALFFENVAGIVMGESLPIFLEFVGQLEDFGYHLYWRVQNCYNLGVPQLRERLFLVAIRDDIPYEFIPPKELVLGRKTQRDAIYDLRDKTLADIKNHDTNSGAVDIFKFRVCTRQTCWDEPSLTIMSRIDASLCYPEPEIPFDNEDYVNRYNFILENKIRKLTVRENLRLQTVGDDFYFPDDIDIVEQYNRCSGIPSLVAYKYGIAIADCLQGRTEKRTKTVKVNSLSLF